MSRRFQLSISTLILALGLATNSPAESVPPITPETTQRIDALFAPWNNAHSPGCVLGVSRSGTVVYTHAYGMSNLEYDIAITPDSIFQAGSISKQFTAFAIGLLARDGKLSLDDDVRRYLPELPDYGQPVTIRQLLAHTGGFRDFGTLLRRTGWRFGDQATEDDAIRILARQKALNFAPGTEFLYSNTGYTLLAVIVRRVSGQSHREFAEARIFAPLGMHDTHIQDDHTMLVRRRASAYEPRPGGGWKINVPNWDISGSTNLFTTAGDLLIWEQNLVDGRVGGKALIDEMQVSGHLSDGRATGYGYGLLLEPYRGVRTINHSGSDGGYRADAVRFPDHDLNVVVLCNLSTIQPRTLTRKVAEIVLGAGAFAPLAPDVRITRTEMDRLVGTYWNPRTDDIWRILVKDGKLMTDGSADALVPLGGGRFRLGEQTTELRFSISKKEATLVVDAPVLTQAVAARVTAPTYSNTELQAYAGDYRSEELEATYTIAVTPEHRLALLRSRFDPIPLEAIKLDMFADRQLGTLSFVRAPSGEITGLVNNAGRTRGLSFTRVDAPAK